MRSSNTPLILSGLCLLILIACSPDGSALKWLHKTERHWAKLEKEQPEWAEMLDPTALESRLDFLATALTKAQDWTKQPLDPAVKNKVSALSNRLQTAQDHLLSQQKDPCVYNLGLRLQEQFSPDRPFEMSQLEKLQLQLDQAANYYQQARQKLTEPVPAQCDSAIAQHISSITYLREELGKKIMDSNLPKVMSKQLEYKINQSCLYMKDYLAWCRSMAFEARN
ncbi:hypothetical protein [Haliscomenobacter sp.]|uniref:hypothetical protein n=1 Tax=Haliscomenobacter sp. TaxID=2717303 RepID=UPI003BAC74DA